MKPGKLRAIHNVQLYEYGKSTIDNLGPLKSAISDKLEDGD